MARASRRGPADHANPAALAEPVEPVRANWITLLFLANIGLWLAIYAPIQVLLPEQVASAAPGRRGACCSPS